MEEGREGWRKGGRDINIGNISTDKKNYCRNKLQIDSISR